MQVDESHHERDCSAAGDVSSQGEPVKDLEDPLAERSESKADLRRLKVMRVVQKDPHMVVLPPNTRKLSFPVECRLCKRKGTGKFAVFDLVNMGSAKYYWQHVQGPTHVSNLRVFAEAAKKASSEPVDCEGFCVQRAQGTKLNTIREEFNLWSTYNCMSSVGTMRDADARHKYTLDLTQNEHVIVHRASEGKFICVKLANVLFAMCSSLGNDPSVIRIVGRFFVKHNAARHLVKSFSPRSFMLNLQFLGGLET